MLSAYRARNPSGDYRRYAAQFLIGGGYLVSKALLAGLHLPVKMRWLCRSLVHAALEGGCH